ncbi:MAG: ROK family protein [Phycisphaerae bacterium]
MVFAQLRALGSSSRAKLAQHTGLSAPTVGKVVEELITAGLVEEAEVAVAEVVMGRPSRPLRLARNRAVILAIQIGVRNTRVAALPVAGPETEAWPVAFATPKRGAALWPKLRAAARALGLEKPLAVTVSIPGVVDERAGRVLFCPHLTWLNQMDLGAELERLWGVPVCLMQEIRALALGHVWAQPQDRDFFLVDFGDGVGGALVSGGRLADSPLPLAGELGHIRVPGNARRCSCGAVGCLETLVNRNGLLQTLAAATGLRRPRWPQLREQIQHTPTVWLEPSLEATASMIGGALNLLGVRQVIMTGAVDELPARIGADLAGRISQAALWGRFGDVATAVAPRRRALGLVAEAVERVWLKTASVEERD